MPDKLEELRAQGFSQHLGVYVPNNIDVVRDEAIRQGYETRQVVGPDGRITLLAGEPASRV